MSTAIYPPEKDRKDFSSYENNMIFGSSEKAIALKRVPIIVGSPISAPDVTTVYIDGTSDFISMKDISTEAYRGAWISPSNTEGFISVHEEDCFVNVKNCAGFMPWLPRSKDTNVKTLEIATVDKRGEMVSYTAFPIGRYNYEGAATNYYWARLALPDRSFPERLIKNRQNLEQQIKNYYRTNSPSLSSENTSK